MKKLLIAYVVFISSFKILCPTSCYSALDIRTDESENNIGVAREKIIISNESSKSIISVIQLATQKISQSAATAAKQATITAANSPTSQSFALATQALEAAATAAEAVTESFMATTVQEATKALEKAATAASKTETAAPQTAKASAATSPAAKKPAAPNDEGQQNTSPVSKNSPIAIQFSTGLETSTFSKATDQSNTDKNLFDKQYGFIQFSAPMSPKPNIYLTPSIRIGRENISGITTDSSTAKEYFKDAQVIQGNLSLSGKIENEIFSDGISPYWKIVPGFIYTNEDAIKKEFKFDAFSGFGFYHYKKEGNTLGDYSGSYIEFGPGYSEKYDDNKFRPLRGELFLNFPNFTIKNNINPFISFRIDAANGPDDFKVFYGFTFNANFISDILKDTTTPKKDQN